MRFWKVENEAGILPEKLLCATERDLCKSKKKREGRKTSKRSTKKVMDTLG